MQDYKTLAVWQKSHTLGLNIYGITRDFPKDVLYELISQIMMVYVSIPSNIAE
jgi:four helix bundle protein